MKHQKSQKGFTIVELMIALSILSSILLISSLLLINLGHLFSKGTNQANTQNTTRAIMGDLASQIELGSGIPQGTPPTADAPGVICIGNQRYTYVLNQALGTDQNNDHALWRDTMVNSNVCTPVLNFLGSSRLPSTPGTEPGANVPGSGSELLSINMRLTDFSLVQNADGTYTIKVTVAFGDDDLINFDATTDSTSCKPIQGDQYCATSSLTQTVVQRLVQSN